MTGAELLLREGAERILGAPLSPGETESFRRYLDVLEAWNRVHRLVGSSDRAWMVENLVLDSLLFLRVLPGSFESILDIGSGAGIPGIPIKIVRPQAALVMAESRRKRASFLASAVRAVGLTNARVFHGRAESIELADPGFEVVVARCAGDPVSILDIGVALAAPHGMVVVAGAPAWRHVPPGTEVARVTTPGGAPTRTFLIRRPKT